MVLFIIINNKRFNRSYQFDEIFELMVDLDEKDREYSKLIMQYPDGRQPIITTIDKIYKGLQENKWKNPALPQVKGYNPYISIKDIRKTKGIYRPKALIFLADELSLV